MTAARELADVAQVMASQWWTRDHLDGYKSTGLAAFVEHARRTTPWYRDLDLGLRASDLLEGLSDLPVLRKSDVLASGAAMRSRVVPADSLVITRTSGTSGARLEVAHDRRAYAYHNAACLRRFLATGDYRPWYRLAHLRPYPMATRWYQRLGLFRRTSVICSWSPGRIEQSLRDIAPQALIGYPTMLREFARTAPAGAVERLRSTLRIIFTESELLLPEHRRQLVETFGVRIYDEYSAYEVLNVTFECSHGGAHIAEDRVHVEVLDAGGRPAPPGDEGEIVVTHFLERGMPLLRYSLGDLGRLRRSDCPCGRTFGLLDLTRGRVADHVRLPDGSLLYSATFLFLAAEHPGVAESAVHQRPSGEVVVTLVSEAAADLTEVERTYRERLFSLAERRFPLQIVWADGLEHTTRGKARVVTRDTVS